MIEIEHTTNCMKLNHFQNPQVPNVALRVIAMLSTMVSIAAPVTLKSMTQTATGALWRLTQT